jgi:DNA-binding NtrC family response regulator
MGNPDHKPDPPHVLVVDDEDLARESLGALLEEDFRVSLASSADEAIEILRRQQPVDVLCTDFQMPGMNGIELIRELSRLSPATVGVLVTGYPDLAANRSAESDGGFLVVVKPFTPDRVLQIVSQAARFGRIRRVRIASDTGGAVR